MGVRTTLPFARWLMEQPRFIAGDPRPIFAAEEWDTRKIAPRNSGSTFGALSRMKLALR